MGEGAGGTPGITADLENHRCRPGGDEATIRVRVYLRPRLSGCCALLAGEVAGPTECPQRGTEPAWAW